MPPLRRGFFLILLPSEGKRLAVELAVVMLDRRLLRPVMLAELGRDASRLRGGVRGPSRTQGVCSPGISASCSHCRPPAIHGRLSAHPLCARRAVARSGLGKDRGQQQQQQQRQRQRHRSKPHPQRPLQQQGDSDRGGSRDMEWRDRFGKESRSQDSMSFQTAGKVVPGAGAGGMPRAGHGWPAAGSGSRTAQIPAGHPPCVRAGRPQPENTNANIPLGWEKNQKKHRREAGVLVSGAAWARGRSATRSRRPTGRWRRRRSRP